MAFWKVARKAKHISRTLGTYRAAKYLRNRGISIEAALIILATRRGE
jgi:hypothetical protein